MTFAHSSIEMIGLVAIEVIRDKPVPLGETVRDGRFAGVSSTPDPQDSREKVAP